MAGYKNVVAAKLLHRLIYTFSSQGLRRTMPGINSFHRGVPFFPSWCSFLSTTVERKEHHDGKN
ncbi:hypothetical protein [Bacteroides helcogenes]|uniref:hypothetical protein n=1 Tax=Bacteroides helcogenes TaxID=290053 RepID=UPI00030DBFB5|nr:hypothetical protein [Bacteroides helcogenes]MDY5239610.1 hypothetical protein [Bacteroides helcogenes]